MHLFDLSSSLVLLSSPLVSMQLTLLSDREIVSRISGPLLDLLKHEKSFGKTRVTKQCVSCCESDLPDVSNSITHSFLNDAINNIVTNVRL